MDRLIYIRAVGCEPVVNIQPCQTPLTILVPLAYSVNLMPTPEILTYRHNGSMVYVPPGQTYEVFPIFHNSRARTY